MSPDTAGLVELFFAHRGKVVDKWEHYPAIYASELGPYIRSGRAVRLLEIGVQNGGSLELWSKYLPAGSEVLGIDVDSKVGTLTFHGATDVIVADISDTSGLVSLLGDKVFDVIIDDGSHYSADIVAAFTTLYDRLAYGGRFIVEDVHACYCPDMGGSLRAPSSAVEFFKQLVDGLNADYFEGDLVLPAEEIGRLRRYGRSLARISFYDSVVVVEKLAAAKTSPYRRMISGVDCQIVDPFTGIAQLEVEKIGALVFSEEQKHLIEAKFLDWLVAARAEMSSLRSRNSDLQTQIAAEAALNAQTAAAQAAAHNDRIAALENMIGGLENKIAGLEDTIAGQMKAHRDPGTTQAERVQEILVEQRSEISRYHRSIAERDLQIAGLQRVVGLLRASISWRLTAPVRAFLSWLPQSAQGRLRRGLKLIWWCITLQIVPKITERRQMLRRQRILLGPPAFDPGWYLAEHTDVASAGMDPVNHYLQIGFAEGRPPAPGIAPQPRRKNLPLNLGELVSRLRLKSKRALAYVTRLPVAAGQLGNDGASHKSYRLHVAEERLRDAMERSDLLQHVVVMTYRPTFLIFIDGDDPAERACSAESCQAQIYPDWQIAASLLQVAEMLSTIDAGSTYLLWIAAGDRLADKAMYACASALNADRSADLVYFDEDEWHPDGRAAPFYKPDWSPDHLEASHYIGRASCFRLSLAGEFLADCRSHYDFTLRFTERAKQIRHVRQVLLHRRDGLSRVISTEEAAADIEAIQGRLRRTGRTGVVAASVPGYASYDVQLRLADEPLVSVVIPTAGKVVSINGKKIDLILNCINSILRRSTYKNLEFIIIDNGDFDRGRLAHVTSVPVKFASFLEADFNVAKKLNIGAAHADGSILLLLNDDVEPLADDWIERMLEHFEKPHVGVVGAKLLYPDLTVQHAGVVLNHGNPDHVRRGAVRDDCGYFFSTCSVRNFHAVTGACMMTTAALYREVGGYTEALGVSFNDVDYCLKLGERGFTAVYAPRAELLHFESQSRKASLDHSELAYFYGRWATVSSDAFYNERNLSVAPPTFEPRHNPRLI